VRRLIAGELRKLATTRLWLWLLIASVGLTVLYAILTIAFDGTPDAFTPPLSTPEGQRTLLAVGAAAAPFAAVLGAVGMTAEFRYRTATATFLATPRRGRVVAAKLVAHAVVGVGYGVVGTAVAALVVLPWLAGRHLSLAVAAGDLPATTGGVLAAVAAFGLIGVGVGALLRDQVAAVVVLLVYLFVLENILTNRHGAARLDPLPAGPGGRGPGRLDPDRHRPARAMAGLPRADRVRTSPRRRRHDVDRTARHLVIREPPRCLARAMTCGDPTGLYS
jgi:ABC-2 type transport system permease protein